MNSMFRRTEGGTFKRLCIAVIFSIAFAYIESAVVVYLRAIFHPDGFTFPMAEFGIGDLWKQMLIVEVGREAATLVLILTAAWMFSRGPQQTVAYFLIIFAVWDIFYYVWLKVLINWPGSFMDWDILFLIPVTWASPVLAPVVVSLSMFVFGVLTLCWGPVKTKLFDCLGFMLAAVIIIVSFCIAGLHIGEDGFCSFFSWPLFLVGNLSAVVLFVRCFLKSKKPDSLTGQNPQT